MIHCEVEEHIPIGSTNWDYDDIRTKAEAACASAILLSNEGCESKPISDEVFDEGIKKALNNLAVNKKANIDSLIITPEGAIRVHNVLREYDMEVISNARQIRNYVTNKLILESENMDARIRMKALELLGKMSDVGLFTERSEVTITNKSTDELESTLKSKLKRLIAVESGVSDAVVMVPEPEQVGKIDVAAELGDL